MSIRNGCTHSKGSIELPDELRLPDDFSDLDELDTIRGQAKQRARAEFVRRVQAEQAAQAAQEPPKPRGLKTTALATIRPEPVRWLVPGYLPTGKLVLIGGEGGLGKSLLTLHLAAAISTGRPALGLVYDAPPTGEVLLCSCEDDYGDTVCPRMIAAGADLDRVHRIDGLKTADGSRQPFTLARIREIDEELADRPTIKLVVVDPIAAFLGAGKIDDHKDSDLRRILDPLAEMAARRAVTIVTVKHLNKATAASAAHRIGGSTAYVNAVRVALLVAADPEDDSRRLLLPLKANLGPQPSGLAFKPEPLTLAEQLDVTESRLRHLEPEDRATLAGQMVRLTWLGPVSMTADDALAQASRKERTGERDAEKAAEWLREQLTAEPRESLWCVEQGNKAIGVPHKLNWWRENVLKTKLNGGSRKADFSGQWYFCLPGQTPKKSESAQQNDRSSSDSSDSSGAKNPAKNSKTAQESEELLNSGPGQQDFFGHPLASQDDPEREAIRAEGCGKVNG